VRLRSERIVTPDTVLAGELTLTGGRIDSLGPVAADGSHDGEVIDVGRAWILPGFIDTHVHGGGGAQCNATDPDEITEVARFHAGHGTTALLATTVSAPVDALVESLGAIATVAEAGPRGDGAIVLGAHLEGPFLSREWHGAMDPETFLEPEQGVVARLLEAGPVQWMTFAPELPGALALVPQLVRAGAVASIGHSGATYEQVRAAVRAGARAATHTFNAMRPLHHREPGVVGAVLDLDEVSCEVICDGVHVDPVALRLAYRAKGPGQIRLVTDAMAAAGMADGEYRLGRQRVRVHEGRALLVEGSQTLAGSTLTMGDAFRNAISFLGVGVPEAATMAATNPARMLGLADHKGALAKGMDADLVVLDDDLRVQATMVAGTWVYRRGDMAYPGTPYSRP
jgi:N-acetylglucosamine-6-phosphate deacetylase